MELLFHSVPHLLHTASLLTGMSYLEEPQRGHVLGAETPSHEFPQR